MAVISEVPDGSSGGDPNKKPQEEEEIKYSFAETPYEFTEKCFAITRRCHYPKLSLTSKEFWRIIHSPELYEKRSSLGVTESVLYASVGIPPWETPRWYILHRDHVSLRLRKIASLPRVLWGSAVVTIGHMMYVMGGSVGKTPTADVTVIDCRFHTYESLPRMRRARSRAAAGAIDGKIYVIGGCRKKADDWVEMFDVESKVWSDVPGPLPSAHWNGQFVTCAVMKDKIHVLDPITTFILDPTVGKLGLWDDGDILKSLWQASSCVVDDLLYTIDPGCSLGHPIVYYDPELMEKKWRPVKGLDFRENFPPLISYYDSKMANLGGKLVILVGNGPWFTLFPHRREEIWCIEISLERREDLDEIWGNVESVKRVLTYEKWPYIELSRTVTF